MVERKRTRLVERQQNLHQELAVIVFERVRKTRNDAAENLQELGDAVVFVRRLVDEARKDVVDGAADNRAQRKKLPVDAVEDSLKKIALARVLAVKKLQQLQFGECAGRGRARKRQR